MRIHRPTIAHTRGSVCRPLLCAVGLLINAACASAPTSNDLGVPTEAELTGQPALVRAWSMRLTADDPETHAAANRVLVSAGTRSLPLLRRLARSRHDNVQGEAMEVLHRVGPDAIPLLTEMLADRQESIRRQAIDILVDLAPDTESIQPALCRALEDPDVLVARDAARALGALARRAAPSTSSLVTALLHGDVHDLVRPRAIACRENVRNARAHPLVGHNAPPLSLHTE